MSRKIVLAVLAIIFLVNLAPVYAQQSRKVYRIGILRAGAPPDRTLELFLQAFRDLGYVDGKNIVLEIRFAEGNPKRSAELAKELVQLNVDALFTSVLLSANSSHHKIVRDSTRCPAPSCTI
jgi:ABC-type uncharacterized transport system substrate-binding protein